MNEEERDSHWNLFQQKGLTQKQLAERMNTTQKMIDYYERRSPNPTLDLMQKIAAALEISVTELLGEEAVNVRAPRKSGPTSKVQKYLMRWRACRAVNKTRSSKSYQPS